MYILIYTLCQMVLNLTKINLMRHIHTLNLVSHEWKRHCLHIFFNKLKHILLNYRFINIDTAIQYKHQFKLELISIYECFINCITHFTVSSMYEYKNPKKYTHTSGNISMFKRTTSKTCHTHYVIIQQIKRAGKQVFHKIRYRLH